MYGDGAVAESYILTHRLRKRKRRTLGGVGAFENLTVHPQ